MPSPPSLTVLVDAQENNNDISAISHAHPKVFFKAIRRDLLDAASCATVLSHAHPKTLFKAIRRDLLDAAPCATVCRLEEIIVTNL